MISGDGPATGNSGEGEMIKQLAFAAAAALMAGSVAWAAGSTDPQIAHIAYTAGKIDVAQADQALAKSKNAEVRSFAEEMKRDHTAVNDQALALVKKLGVTPEDNPTSQSLAKASHDKMAELASLNGAAFDKAYMANEVAYHQTVNGALSSTLIPSAQNPELNGLLQTGLKLFTEHQHHAEHVAATLK
jgi:putative membrane protein